MEDCVFALQFLVDSNHMFNMCTASSDIFNKTNYTEEKEMDLKPESRNPDDIYEFIYNLFTGVIIEKLNILLEKVNDDNRVMPYVSYAITKLLTNMKRINRVKMERVMTTIKIGINPNCKFETTKALAELEHYVDILYPHNRRYLTEDEKFKFMGEMSQIMRRGNEPMRSLLEKIDLSKSFTEITCNLIKKSGRTSNPKEIIKIIASFIQKLPLIETPMDSINAAQSIFDVVNEISGNRKIEYSQICISTILINDELYIYYYGKLDEMIAGCFSVDFKKFKNIIDVNFTYYVFYFVICCYCLNEPDNIFSIDLGIEKSEVNNMFIFLENKYLSLFREKCKTIDDGMIYVKILRHLEKFLKSIKTPTVFQINDLDELIMIGELEEK